MDLWSQMPKDLLQQIAGYLDTQFDLLRFRSVCSSWRSSIPPIPNNYLHRRFTVLPNIGISATAWGFYLSKRAIFLIGPPQSCDETPWLIKLGQGKSQRLTLLNPIVRHPFLTLPDNFPKNLDLLNLRVLELGQEHVLQYMNVRHFRTTFGDPSALYLEKVAFLNRGRGSDFYEGKDYVLLTIHVSGKLALFRSGDKEWSIIHDMPSPYDDVIMFNGSFYAVDSNGRIVIVGLDLSTSLVADAVLGGDKKYLVESMGELLLVDTYLSIDIEGEDQDEVEFRAEDMLGRCMSERTLRFKVYKLDREGNKWNEVRDLGDRVLFLGDDSTFSASFRDLGLCKGNFIFFADNVFQFNPVDDDMLEGHDVGVFDMESGSIGSLDNHPRYSKLFWPPPDWIFASRISEVNNQLESLRL